MNSFCLEDSNNQKQDTDMYGGKGERDGGPKRKQCTVNSIICFEVGKISFLAK
jgi:hypothetical protein